MRQPVLPYPNRNPQYPYPIQIANNNAWAQLALPNPALKINTNNPQVFSTSTPAGTPVIDRVAFFVPQPPTVAAIPSSTNPTTTTPTMDVESWRQFYVKPGFTPIVPPNRYAVVGPASLVADPYMPGAPAFPSGAPTGMATMLGARSFAGDSDPADANMPSTIKNAYYGRVVLDPTVAAPTVLVHNDPAGTYLGAYSTSPPVR